MGQCDSCGAELKKSSTFCPQCGAEVAESARSEPAPGPPDVIETVEASPTPYRYWAFISYSSHDKAWADWLHRSIESYGIPSRLVNHETPVGEAAPKRLRPVFRDRAELSASSDLAREIEDALAASRYLIVICSPAAARSKWVDTEIETFQRMGRSGRILALIVDGEPHAGDERECMPPALLASEPIAADARKEGDGKENARLKLLAGMLGIGFDALKQREMHRRMRRLQIGVAIASVIALGFAGIAWYAETQRVTAVKSRQQAERTMEYVLWDLRTPLEKIGRLDILRGATDLVDTYYRELGVDAGNVQMSHTREAALLSNGVAAEEQGDLPGALAQYRAALAISEQLASANPSDARFLGDLAIVNMKVAGVLEAQGDVAGAATAYLKALDIRSSLAQAVPEDPQRQRDLAETLVDAAGVLTTQAQYAGALQFLQQALTINQKLVAVDPANMEWQGDLAVVYSRIGETYLLQGNASSALPAYQAALQLDLARANADPSNANYQSRLPAGYLEIGDIERMAGDAAAALREYNEALRIAKHMVAVDSGNVEWQRALAGAHSRIGSLLLGQGKIKRAAAEYASAAMIYRKVAAADPTSVIGQRDLYTSHMQAGDVLSASRDYAGAMREYDAAAKIMRALVDAYPNNPMWPQSLKNARDLVRIAKTLQDAAN